MRNILLCFYLAMTICNTFPRNFNHRESSRARTSRFLFFLVSPAQSKVASNRIHLSKSNTDFLFTNESLIYVHRGLWRAKLWAQSKKKENLSGFNTSTSTRKSFFFSRPTIAARGKAMLYLRKILFCVCLKIKPAFLFFLIFILFFFLKIFFLFRGTHTFCPKIKSFFWMTRDIIYCIYCFAFELRLLFSNQKAYVF